MLDLQSWLPTIVMLCGLVAQAVMMREQVKVLDRRMKRVEEKVERISDFERLKTDVAELAGTVEEMRDSMLRAGQLGGAAARRRARTPVMGVPAPPKSRDSDEEG